MGSARRGWSLLTRFGVISLLLVLATGVVSAVLLRAVLVDRTVQDAHRTAVSVANVGIHAHLRPADLARDFLPLDATRVAELDGALAASTADADGFARIKVWNAQRWLVYSDNVALRGRWFPGDALLDGALLGEVTSEVTDLSGPDEFEEAARFDTLLAVYVPLRARGDSFVSLDDDTAPVVGASEVYLPWEPIAAEIRRDTIRLVGVLATGLLVLYAALYRLVASASATLRRQSLENEHLARHDQLTGLANRVGFEEQAADALARGPVALALLDVDGFQVVNDTLGHDHGDGVLRELASRLQAIHPSGHLGRLGGDEFAVLLPGRDADTARQDAEAVLGLLDPPVEVAGLALPVQASVGIAVASGPGSDPGTLLRQADVAMYVAKRTRGRVRVYDPAIDGHSTEKLTLATEVRAALDAGQLVLHYQPQLSLERGEVVAVEALLRWEHPQRGTVSPGMFLPIVETTDLVHDVTRHVVDLAVRELAGLRATGADLRVSANVAAHALLDPTLVDHIARRLTEHGVPPAALSVELTESALLTDPARARLVLEELARMGVGISIDDFGTGYASLSYLREFPVDELKLDRSLVSTATAPGQDPALLEASIALGRRLGLTVVAEGIEDEATLRWLRAAGCDLAQGFLLARPMPPEDLRAWLPTSTFRLAPLLASEPRLGSDEGFRERPVGAGAPEVRA